MNLLIIAATEGELGPLKAHLQNYPVSSPNAVTVFTTGVGMVFTTYNLTRHLRQTDKYDLIVQAGVAGAFDRNLHMGDVVFVTSDEFADLGAEDHDDHLTIFEMGLLDKNTPPFAEGKLATPLQPVHGKINLTRVTGLTVNTVSGNENSISRLLERSGAQIESMEGAAFHYVCLLEDIPFAQVRAISNYVMPRDKSQWRMKDAVINLNNWLIEFINKL